MIKKIIFLITVLFAVQCTCKRTSERIGPDACPTEQFKILTPLSFVDNASSSSTSLNLLSSFASIGITFNESISYTLTIDGLTSGAQFVLTGTSPALAYNWYGNSTNGKYFAKGEVLSYKVTNICKTEVLGSGQITLTTIIGYAGFGLKVINYEDSPAVAVASYGDCFAGACSASKLMTPASVGYSASPQGQNYYQYRANCTLKPEGVSWYFGGQDFNNLVYTSLGADPTKIYLNFFAKGQANSQAQFIIKESVHGTELTRKFLANVSPGAWALYSVKLSDIGIINPANIKGMSFNLGATTYQDTSAQVDLDMILFTFDQPF